MADNRIDHIEPNIVDTMVNMPLGPKTKRPNTTAVPPSANDSDTPKRIATNSMLNMPIVRSSGVIVQRSPCR